MRLLTQLEPTLFLDTSEIVMIRVRPGNFDPTTKHREAILDIVLVNGRAESLHLPYGKVGEARIRTLFGDVSRREEQMTANNLYAAVFEVWEQTRPEKPMMEPEGSNTKEYAEYLERQQGKANQK